MIMHSVNEIRSLINNQISMHEKIREYLLKTEAIVQVALTNDFLDHNKNIINTYLWVLCDMIGHLKDLHEGAFDDLLKNHSCMF